MTDPRRLIEEDEVARLLLGSAASDAPGAESRARARSAALASVGVGVSVGLVAGTAKGAAKATSLIALKWLVIAAIPVTLATVGYLQVTQRPKTTDVSVATRRARPPAGLAAALAATPSASAALALVAAPSSQAPPGPVKAAESSVRAPGSLQKEITELDAARHALARGDVSVLDRYFAEHPHGALREQALWMKISSLQQSGRHGEASALARRLLAAYPNGAFAIKARALAAP